MRVLHDAVDDAPDSLFRAVEQAAHRTGRVQHEYHLESRGRARCDRQPANDPIRAPTIQPKIGEADTERKGNDGGQDSGGQGIHESAPPRKKRARASQFYIRRTSPEIVPGGKLRFTASTSKRRAF